MPIGAASLHSSLHASRSRVHHRAPARPAHRGPGWGPTWDARGALVVLGYPYDFEELVVVDLPPDDRHPLYQSERFGPEETDRGRVRYEYRSMADLSFAPDESVDLIYSGQSIEHVSEADGDVVLEEVVPDPRAGGSPGGRHPERPALSSAAAHFIDPDHKVEYTLPELREKLSPRPASRC